MPKSLIIVESPAKAKTINKILGKDYEVTASYGHIRDLPRKELGVDIENSFEPKYVIPADSKKRVTELKKLASKSEEILLAADPDREGEAISWHLAQILKEKNDNIKRVRFNAITPAAVKDAVAHPGPINLPKVDAQQARRILDRLVGYQISPLLWRSVKRGLSAGRVQSVAVRLICEREEEVQAFVPVEFWSIAALLKTMEGVDIEASLYSVDGTRIGKEGGEDEDDDKSAKTRRIGKAEEAEEIVERLKKADYILRSIEQKAKTRHAPPPYITSTLQQDASRRLGMTSDRTMRVAQSLYEGIEIDSDVIGLITYMRTDSVRVSEEGIASARDYIKAEIGNDYLPKSPNRYKTKGAAQDAHEAIRPTYVEHSPEKIKKHLNKDQFRLYDLIWKRFVSCQMASAKFLSTTANIEADNCVFRARGLQMLFDGFLRVYRQDQDDQKDKLLPKLEENQPLNLVDLRPEQHFTKPPARYNEASLIKELEERGIGRPSTYAAIVKTIQSRSYVEKKEKVFLPTELGKVTNALLIKAFPEILDVGFTAKVEDQLDKVEEGQENWQHLLSSFYGPFSTAVEEATKGLRDALHDMEEETEEVCEKCGLKMVKKWGRNGWFIACPGYPECKNTKSLNGSEAKETDKKCPECGSTLLLRSGKMGEFYACSAYPKCKYSKSIGIGIPCPKDGCDGEVTSLKGRRGKVFYGCTNYPKCDFISWDLPVVEKCPKCNNPFLVRKDYKRTGPVVKCPVKACDYSRPDTDADDEKKTG